MSDTDSFIDEVSEEVRKDRLYGYLRRYGWIAGVVVIAVVGGTAYSEWSKSTAASAAQARGDVLLDALDQSDSAGRATALEAVVDGGDSNVVAAFLAASEMAQADQADKAVALLATIAQSADVDPLYRDLAILKGTALDVAADPAARRLAFETISAPGAPYRVLAEEQLALIDVEAGDIEAAITRLQGLVVDFETNAGLQRRAIQLIVALGGTPELAN